ncbi:hypothetical protein [uncultured Gammaproteobacteria bacterium]|uniref:hypothetical protein n=1 Tax=Bathymodiolus heckerae thiotrophic gill symbiont TaxID=1052212 RepID=UPI0010B1CAB8|nr:hypothetical protein [Bathymodiolus heckerae thiotrophic gill symbiont]CAC9527122.1 hypothetical protein [uncultured Gammaproteobacteria bacterium]CAC9964860.1 hypothetical protein [uncultured Gammaproteobacteria bacterium]SHN92683.1 hypothetical protein BHECKSOX_1279 [Bathymodiolus heckerae thiotrophic gill symbiont]
MINRKTRDKPIEKSIANVLKDTATRVAYLTDTEMKKFKIKSVISNINIKILLDNALSDLMKDKDPQFEKIKVKAVKRSFTINQDRLNEMKLYLINHDNATQDLLIYNAILKII